MDNATAQVDHGLAASLKLEKKCQQPLTLRVSNLGTAQEVALNENHTMGWFDSTEQREGD